MEETKPEEKIGNEQGCKSFGEILEGIGGVQDGIQATSDVPEVLEQNWLGCLPRPAEWCRIKIVGNSIVITPVQITDIP
jgi:hypothetical protein